MPRSAGLDNLEYDVVVIGAHPSASLAAMLLSRQTGLRVMRVRVPDAAAEDRLTLINPELFALDDALTTLPTLIDAMPANGLQFLSNEAPTAGEFHSKQPSAFIASTKAVRDAMERLAVEAGVASENNRRLDISSINENGVEIQLDAGRSVLARMLIIADDLPPAQRSALGLDEHGARSGGGGGGGEPGEIHRYSYIKCKGNRGIELGTKPLVPMALDIAGQLIWGWLLLGKSSVQFCIEQSPEQAKAISPRLAMQAWLELLVAHGIVPRKNLPDLSTLKTLELPLAGALSREGVANRTLLIGPAGGFYSACAEEIYPACWSAVFAVDVARRALKEAHLQDALQIYRQKWGSTLGDYLRGPQQNLRFLLPLIYRNKTMATRIGEAILTGQSVVR